MDRAVTGRRLLVAASTFFLSDEIGKVTVLSLFLQLLPWAAIDQVVSDQGESTRGVAPARCAAGHGDLPVVLALQGG
jgi:hypothetical protein